MSAAPVQLTVHVPELTNKLHNALLAISNLARGKESVSSMDIYAAIQRIAFDPEPSVPVEYDFGSSPYADGSWVSMRSSEDAAIWARDYRGHHIYRRPVPAAWELVQP